MMKNTFLVFAFCVFAFLPSFSREIPVNGLRFDTEVNANRHAITNLPDSFIDSIVDSARKSYVDSATNNLSVFILGSFSSISALSNYVDSAIIRSTNGIRTVESDPVSIPLITSHSGKTDNPHHVTAAQAGAVGIANFISATNTIANTPSWRIVDNVTNAQSWIDGTGCVWSVGNSSIKMTILSGEGEGIHILKKTDNYLKETKEEMEIAKEDGGLSLTRGKYYEEDYFYYSIEFSSGGDSTFTKDTPIPSKNDSWINHQNDLYMEEYFTTNLVGRLALTNDVVTKDTRNLHADIATNMVWRTVISNGYLYVVAYTNDTSILR